MSDKRRLTPGEAGEAVMASIQADEAERLAGLSREERDREARAVGLDPEATRAKGAALAARLLAEKGAGPVKEAPVVALPRPDVSKARSHAVWWLVAAGFALAVGLLAEGHAVVAWLKGDLPRIGPDDERVPEAPAAIERANALRNDAQQACKEASWGSCRAKLDEAQRLDPAGEDQRRVQVLRAVLAEASERGNAPKDLKDDGKRP